MYVYRVGSLTPREKIPSKTSLAFDSTYPIPDHCSPRSDSVFASLSQETLFTKWLPYRKRRNLDTLLYRIKIPNDVPIYFYDLDLYDRVDEAAIDLPEPYRKKDKHFIREYWESAQLIHNWNGEPLNAEVLIPYDIAKNLTWEQIPYSMEEVW